MNSAVSSVMPARGDQARRVPGRPGGERVALDQDDVGPAQMREVVGDAAADHAAADDHDLRAGGQRDGPGATAVRHAGDRVIPCST